jgi:hypothetical protein
VENLPQQPADLYQTIPFAVTKLFAPEKGEKKYGKL